MKKILGCALFVASLNASAVLGPIPIYLNTEYRTDNPVIGAIASTLSFNADDIKATGANTFLEFLATVPSVNLSNPQGGVPAVFIRGNKSEHTLFVVDGVSIVSANSLNGAIEYGMNNIPLNDIEKIDIIRNSGSVLYGSGAIAGVISITTKKGADKKTATLGAKFGTHNAKIYTLSATTGDQDGFIRFTHNQYTTDGINAQTGDTTGEKDSVNNRSTQVKIGNKHFDISHLQARNKAEYDGFGGTDSGELGDTQLTQTTLNTNKTFNDTWQSRLSVSQIKDSRNSGVNAATIGDKYKNINITLLNDIKIGDALLNVGVAKIDDENTTKNKKASSQDLFLNWQKNSASVDVNIGTRHIKHSKFGNKTIYNTAIAKYLNNGIKLIATHGTAFKAPSLKNLYGWDFSSSGIGYSSGGGNLDLKPETATNTELGIEKQHSWGVLGARLYQNKVKNLITWEDDSANPPPNYDGKYINIEQLSTKGIELSVNANIFGYAIDFNHNYNNAKENNSTTQAINRPKNTTNLTISKRHNGFNSRMQIIRKSSHDIANNLQGFTLVNLSSDYTMNKQATLSLHINNAFDKDYTLVNGYNQSSRTFELGLDYQF